MARKVQTKTMERRKKCKERKTNKKKEKVWKGETEKEKNGEKKEENFKNCAKKCLSPSLTQFLFVSKPLYQPNKYFLENSVFLTKRFLVFKPQSN